MTIIFEAIRNLRPKAQFNCGDSLDSIAWLDHEKKPTDAEILAEVDRLDKLAQLPPSDWNGFRR
ncbi:MAG: hypothetical protein AAF215_27950 [Cyanobacteria bacterium P01_A01_bin.123]